MASPGTPETNGPCKRQRKFSQHSGDRISPCEQFCVGQHVRIQGLVSPAGQALNNLEGVVYAFEQDSARLGVNINGVGRRSIKRGNLEALDNPLSESISAGRL